MLLTFSNAELIHKLSILSDGLDDTSPLTRQIAKALHSNTLLNFKDGGRPKWQDWSDSYAKRMERKGRSQSLLQEEGNLKGSLSVSNGNGWASVEAGSGASAKYAAIHQYGGPIGRNHATTMPARPYLPMTADNNLQPEFEQGALDVINLYWQNLL